MRARDLLQLTSGAIAAQPLRAGLTGLGIAVGIAAVILLTAIGEGIHRYVIQEFTQFGTNLVAVTPGKTETFGISGALIGSVRPLTIRDAQALARLPGIIDVAPMVQGNARAEAGSRSRRTLVFGVGAGVPRVWSIPVAAGRFLPDDDPEHSRAYAVLGSKLRKELFRDRNPLGQRIRVGGEAYRIIGVMHPKGQMLGYDLDDSVYLPVGRVLALFNRQGLMEIDLLYQPEYRAEQIRDAIKKTLLRRHSNEDFTVTTQQQMLEVLGSVLGVLTFAVGALGGISLLVGGVGILSIMSIAVNERITEIGLLRALGAQHGQIRQLFLGEAVLLALAGGLAGLALGIGLALALGALLPSLPVHLRWEYALAAEGVAIVIGLIAGVAPALRAARLSPLEALRSE